MGMAFLLIFWLAFFGGTVYSGFAKEELPVGIDGALTETER